MSYAVKQSTSKIPFYEVAAIADGGDVRTFNGDIYYIRGVIAQHAKTKEVVKLSSIYYEIRTVKDKFRRVVAKRKNPNDELKRV